MKKVVKDENQRCIVCGCILGKYRADGLNVCEVCRDDFAESELAYYKREEAGSCRRLNSYTGERV